MTFDWTTLLEPIPAPDIPYPRVCKTAKCQRCGRFTSKLYPVWSSGWPTPDVLYEVGDCCKEKLLL